MSDEGEHGFTTFSHIVTSDDNMVTMATGADATLTPADIKPYTDATLTSPDIKPYTDATLTPADIKPYTDATLTPSDIKPYTTVNGYKSDRVGVHVGSSQGQSHMTSLVPSLLLTSSNTILSSLVSTTTPPSVLTPVQSTQYQLCTNLTNLPDNVTTKSVQIYQCCWLKCDNCYNQLDDLVNHVNDQHVKVERPDVDFQCKWTGCPRKGRGFNARYKMLIHVRTHTNEKPHKCSVCSKSFSRLENLKIHNRSHTGEKPYCCSFPGCNKAYSNSSDRFKHVRTHQEQKPYICKLQGCNKRYTDPSSLRKHVRTHKHYVQECVLSSDYNSQSETKGNNSNFLSSDQKFSASQLLPFIPVNGMCDLSRTNNSEIVFSDCHILGSQSSPVSSNISKTITTFSSSTSMRDFEPSQDLSSLQSVDCGAQVLSIDCGAQDLSMDCGAQDLSVDCGPQDLSVDCEPQDLSVDCGPQDLSMTSGVLTDLTKPVKSECQDLPLDLSCSPISHSVTMTTIGPISTQ